MPFKLPVHESAHLIGWALTINMLNYLIARLVKTCNSFNLGSLRLTCSH